MYPYRLLVKLKLQKAVWRAFDELTHRQLCLIYFAVGGRGDAPTNIRTGLNETEHLKLQKLEFVAANQYYRKPLL